MYEKCVVVDSSGLCTFVLDDKRKKILSRKNQVCHLKDMGPRLRWWQMYAMRRMREDLYQAVSKQHQETDERELGSAAIRMTS